MQHTARYAVQRMRSQSRSIGVTITIATALFLPLLTLLFEVPQSSFQRNAGESRSQRHCACYNMSALSHNIDRTLKLDRPSPCHTHWSLSSNQQLPAAALVLAVPTCTPLLSVLRTIHSVLSGTPSNVLPAIYVVLPPHTNLRPALIIELQQLRRVHVLSAPVADDVLSLRRFGAAHAKRASIAALVFLTPSTEVTSNWLRPLLAELHEDIIKRRPDTVVVPVLHDLDPRTLHPRPTTVRVVGHDWGLRRVQFVRSHPTHSTALVYTPLLPHSDFAIRTSFFASLGSVSSGTDLALAVWTRPGAIATSPCSRIARPASSRLFCKHPPTDAPLDTLYRSRARRLTLAHKWLAAYEPLARLANGALPRPLVRNAPANVFDTYLGTAFPEMLPSAQIMLGAGPLRAWGTLALADGSRCAAFRTRFETVQCSIAHPFLITRSGFVMPSPHMTAACITRTQSHRLKSQRCELDTIASQQWYMQNASQTAIFALRDQTPLCLTALPDARLVAETCSQDQAQLQTWEWQFRDHSL